MPRPRTMVQRATLNFSSVSKPGTDSDLGSKKRKHDPTTADDERPSSLSVTTSIKKRRVVVITPPDTPTKAIKHSIANLNLSVSASNLSSATNLKRKRHASPEIDIAVSSPPSSPTRSNGFTNELEDLKRLNCAFLSALSLHYAHNGNSNTVDLRMLTPSITKLWGKRKVTIEDIRLIVAIIHSTSTSKSATTATRFLLKDYGEGKVCLERVARQRKGRGPAQRTFNEADTIATFNANLASLWESHSKQIPSSCFTASISPEPLVPSSTLAKLGPLRAKGQRRLEDVLTPFKNINLSDHTPTRPFKRTKAAHTSTVAPVSKDKENTTPEPPANPSDRSSSLLARIHAKEAAAASAAPAPTKEQRERMAALQRAEEVLQVLQMLAVAKGGSARASFPMSMLVRNVQASMRSPLAREEIERVIKLLQTEVAPGHIGVVTFGSVTGVVVDRNRKPGVADIKARLVALGV
ncbi:hypothetical protein BT63DRAFT_420263 [Microthyrium microscopicum]|uniref:DNA replication factor Cdt1 C-terminal domain-containing protein n=1 Tax=Microthyrium microscopicum TaxID=703497 RepID=A0A6A6UVM8_9PEZI|nr:hypothetical protein BT63DRAFT_420263 [Microthyrium microscopicum]